MNRHEIALVLQHSGYPSLTISLPTHRTSPDKRQDRIRLRNLIKEARERLLAEFSQREVEPLLTRLESLSKEVHFRYTLDGLILFVNQDFGAKYYLPYTLPERVAIADTFLTRDLVFAMNRAKRYWVLALSEKPTRLYEGARDTLVEATDVGFPLVHEGPGGEQSLPGGFGIKKSAYRDERHRQFFRLVDETLKPVMVEDPLPLVIVGVDRYQSFFKEVTTHGEHILATLNGSHDKTSPHKLAQLVWPLAQAGFAELRQQNMAALNAAIGEQKFASTIDEVWRLSNEGRARLLVVEEDFHFPAKLDETGLHLLPADDPAAPGFIPDAVDDVIETVLSKQGRVVFCDNGQLEPYQRIALVLRY